MKKIIVSLLALFILATSIITVSANSNTLSVMLAEEHMSNQEVLDCYIKSIRNGTYYDMDDIHFVTVIDGRECYTTSDGKMYYDNEVLYENIATLDKDIPGTLIGTYYNTAIYADSDFITIYSFGEIVTIINAKTGNFPLG